MIIQIQDCDITFLFSLWSLTDWVKQGGKLIQFLQDDQGWLIQRKQNQAVPYIHSKAMGILWMLGIPESSRSQGKMALVSPGMDILSSNCINRVFERKKGLEVTSAKTSVV